MSLGIKLDGITLATVGDGRLERRFQDLLAQVVEIHENAFEYAGNNKEERVTRVRLEIEFRYTPAIGGNLATTMIDAGGEIASRPKAIRNRQAAYTRDGAILIEANPATQLEAFEKTIGRQ